MSPRNLSTIAIAALGLSALLAMPLRAQQEVVYPPGVTKEVHESIQRGLMWLSRNQANDGSFRNNGGYGSYPAAMTGLAGMALIASGSTPTRGKYWREVRQATEFLLRNTNPTNGLISVMREEAQGMYGHGFSMLFLASAYGMEEDVRKQEKLKAVLDKGVELIVAAQSKAGGWWYTPDADNDEGSVTVTQMQALRACHMSGIFVDKKCIDRAVDYIKKCQNADGSIRYKFSGAGDDGRPAITAAGIAVFYNAGVYDDQDYVRKAFDYCKKNIQVTVDTTGFHFYTQLYWSQALYQRGGEEWTNYYAKQSAWLVGQQAKDGSWDSDGVGSVYGTAIALLILQLPYALAPIYQR